jgi:hypothetical protein
VGFIITDFEFMYGHRQRVWNQRGNENVIAASLADSAISIHG